MKIAHKKTETQDLVTYLFDASVVSIKEIKEFLINEDNEGNFTDKQVTILVDNASEDEAKDIQIDLYKSHYGLDAAKKLKEITFADDEKLSFYELMSSGSGTCGPSHSCGGGRGMFNL